MSLDSIVTVIIDKQDASLTQVGFGTTVIAGYHTVFADPEFTRTYDAATGLAAMVTDGFLATEPIHKAATAYLSSSPRVSSFKIGLLETAPVYTSRITPVKIDEGFIYDFDIISHAGVSTNITYTVLAGSSVAIIVTALQALIDAITGIAAADDTTHVTVTTDGTGELAAVVNTHRATDLLTENLTADTGIATDLATLQAADDEWYGLLMSSNSGPQVLAATTFTEARTKLFGGTASDTECLDATVTDDVCSTARDSSLFRSFIVWSENDFDFAAATLMGEEFPFQPGSRTWEFKTLSGVVVSALEASEVSALTAKNAVTYTTVSGRNVTRNAKTPGGEFIDITHGIDEMTARIQEGVFGVLLANGKVPFTKAGVAMIVNPIQGVLDVRADPDINFLSPDPAPVASGPDPATVPAVDKAARLLPKVKFAATVAGAIHAVDITGNVSVGGS